VDNPDELLPEGSRRNRIVRPSEVIMGIFGSPSDRANITVPANNYADVVRPLKDAEASDETRKVKEATEKRAFREYFKRTLPPKKRSFAEETRVTTFWENRRARLYEACPTFAIEQVWSEVFGAEGRLTKSADALDKEHLTVGFAYADFFVSNDERLRERAEEIRNRLPMCRLAKVVSSLEEMQQLIETQAART
jgi:hypothetical protein